jgi:hypothetical protein
LRIDQYQESQQRLCHAATGEKWRFLPLFGADVHLMRAFRRAGMAHCTMNDACACPGPGRAAGADAAMPKSLSSVPKN